jgi:glycosyltransferase involved in cell wall biosynthesis
MNRKLNDIISIVTPSLNQGQFLEQTITGVLSQSGDFYIDYIIADGGSTDHSVEIIKKYDELIKGSNFACRCRGVELRWWSQKDKGQSAALNHAFGKARGDILAWINSDDYYNDSNVFQTISDKFIAHRDVDLICGSGRRIDEAGREKSMHRVEGDIDESSLLRRGCVIFQPSAFFTRKIFYEAGGINADLHYAFDLDLWIRMVRKSKCLVMDEILSNFREWENSKSITATANFIREEKFIAKKYGGSIINFRLIQKLRRGVIIFDWLKKYLPSTYQKGRNIFYSLVDRLHY